MQGAIRWMLYRFGPIPETTCGGCRVLAILGQGAAALAVNLLQASFPFRAFEDSRILDVEEVTVPIVLRRNLVDDNRHIPIAGFMRQFPLVRHRARCADTNPDVEGWRT